LLLHFIIPSYPIINLRQLKDVGELLLWKEMYSERGKDDAWLDGTIRKVAYGILRKEKGMGTFRSGHTFRLERASSTTEVNMALAIAPESLALVIRSS